MATLTNRNVIIWQIGNLFGDWLAHAPEDEFKLLCPPIDVTSSHIEFQYPLDISL